MDHFRPTFTFTSLYAQESNTFFHLSPIVSTTWRDLQESSFRRSLCALFVVIRPLCSLSHRSFRSLSCRRSKLHIQAWSICVWCLTQAGKISWNGNGPSFATSSLASCKTVMPFGICFGPAIRRQNYPTAPLADGLSILASSRPGSGLICIYHAYYDDLTPAHTPTMLVASRSGELSGPPEQRRRRMWKTICVRFS